MAHVRWRTLFLEIRAPAIVIDTIFLAQRQQALDFRHDAIRFQRTILAGIEAENQRAILQLQLFGISHFETNLEQIHRQLFQTIEVTAGKVVLDGVLGIRIATIFQQFVGINVIFYYSNVLWEAVGFDESQSFLITVITSVVNIVTTLIAIALIDKIGRKPLLLIGSTGMAVTLATMAIIFGTAHQVNGTPQLGDVTGPVALIAANLFVVAFGATWGPLVWVLLGEMFPNRIRAAALVSMT